MKQQIKLYLSLIMKQVMHHETSGLWIDFIYISNASTCYYIIRINYEYSYAYANAFTRCCWHAYDTFFSKAFFAFFCVLDYIWIVWYFFVFFYFFLYFFLFLF